MASAARGACFGEESSGAWTQDQARLLSRYANPPGPRSSFIARSLALPRQRPRARAEDGTLTTLGAPGSFLFAATARSRCPVASPDYNHLISRRKLVPYGTMGRRVGSGEKAPKRRVGGFSIQAGILRPDRRQRRTCEQCLRESPQELASSKPQSERRQDRRRCGRGSRAGTGDHRIPVPLEDPLAVLARFERTAHMVSASPWT